MLTDDARRKGVAARIASRRAAALETRTCAGCGKPITKIRARFTSTPEKTYCSVQCHRAHTVPRRCSHVSADGKPCRAYAATGTDFCPRHTQRPLCKGTTAQGAPCNLQAAAGSDFCAYHQATGSSPTRFCTFTTRTGKTCGKPAKKGSDLCHRHQETKAWNQPCQATTRYGTPCPRHARRGEQFCERHLQAGQPTCKGTNEDGLPCKLPAKRGYDFCTDHLAQRTRTPEEKATEQAALASLDAVEADLKQRIPPGVAIAFVRDLRAGVADTPHLAESLASASPDYLQELAQFLQSEWRRLSTPRRPQAARPIPLPPTILFQNDRIFMAAVRALSRLPQWAPLPGFTHGAAETFRSADRLTVTVGLPDTTHRDTPRDHADLWAFLVKGGVRMVKAHYALWARWFEADPEPGQPVTISINQFCADIGYDRHKHGGFDPRTKREAARILDALAALELLATFLHKGEEYRIRGVNLWDRVIAERRDSYADLFGASGVGDPNTWEPETFIYAPGRWIEDATWRSRNHYIGKIGAGLLKLESDTDEWAILIGGYLGTLMRANAYAPIRLHAGTILRRTDLAQSNDAKRRAGRTEDRLAKALDKLRDAGVIAEWTWPEVDTTELTDDEQSDPDAIEAYARQDPFPPGDWRRRLVEITLPAEREEDRERIEVARAKAITAHKPTTAARTKRENRPAEGPAQTKLPLNQ